MDDVVQDNPCKNNEVEGLKVAIVLSEDRTEDKRERNKHDE